MTPWKIGDASRHCSGSREKRMRPENNIEATLNRIDGSVGGKIGREAEGLKVCLPIRSTFLASPGEGERRSGLDYSGFVRAGEKGRKIGFLDESDRRRGGREKKQRTPCSILTRAASEEEGGEKGEPWGGTPNAAFAREKPNGFLGRRKDLTN